MEIPAPPPEPYIPSPHAAFGSAHLLDQRRLTWLALGLLLAAWNAADDEAAGRERPAPLKRHSVVSVRAVTHAASGATSAQALPRIACAQPAISRVTKSSSNCKTSSF
jgi:hypothetical protein